MTAGAPSLHRKHIWLLSLVWLGALPFGWPIALSLALGGGIQIMNLRALERGTAAMLHLAAHGHSAGARILVAFRFVLLLGVVAFVLTNTSVEPLAFMVGLSLVVPAVIWHGLACARLATGRGV